MSSRKQLVVFVHGWGVTHTKTYGHLPERLAAEASAIGLDISVREIFLGKYVSFRDEVRLEDISHAFEAAVQRELKKLVVRHGRFACITHSTGGPVVRDWLRRYHSRGTPPLSHLVMLAPANFGSALAQLGKGRLSRLKTWFEGVEPGAGVLDWLELGSSPAWDLNLDWIKDGHGRVSARRFFPFVIMGQTIDRKLFDHLSSYTGENGSDGVVRVAAANLNATHVRLEQEAPRRLQGRMQALRLRLDETSRAPETAMCVVPGKSHSGGSKGVMRSVKRRRGSAADEHTLAAILDALAVRSISGYRSLCRDFDRRTAEVQEAERLEIVKRVLVRDTRFIHDRCSMVIFRLRDEQGYPIEDFDLLLTAGKNHDPNHLPQGFFLDRQQNRRDRSSLTYFFNFDVMLGADSVHTRDGDLVREALPGTDMLGLKIQPRPTEGFVHYLPCDLQASAELLREVLQPNQTSLIEIVLRRVVREGVFRMDSGVRTRSFKKDDPGPHIS